MRSKKDKRIGTPRNQSNKQSHNTFNAQVEENLYICSLVKAFKDFLTEESLGQVFTEERLLNKIKASRLLFPEDRELLKNAQPRQGGVQWAS